jgi:hypothetical protein
MCDDVTLSELGGGGAYSFQQPLRFFLWPLCHLIAIHPSLRHLSDFPGNFLLQIIPHALSLTSKSILLLQLTLLEYSGNYIYQTKEQTLWPEPASEIYPTERPQLPGEVSASSCW